MTDKYKEGMTDEEVIWAVEDFIASLVPALTAYNKGADKVAAALSVVAALQFVNSVMGSNLRSGPLSDVSWRTFGMRQAVSCAFGYRGTVIGTVAA
jgi:hypothetical protein